MRYKSFRDLGILVGALALCSRGMFDSGAFPPAPDHTFYGMVRDEMGNPLSGSDVQVLLETATGVQIKGSVVNALEPGVNYHLVIPMDAGITSDLYKPTALKPTVPFKMWVRIKGVRYLPIQMKGDYSRMGEPGKTTRLDLTLGEDSDNDGLPDAWERALIAALGGKLTLADIKPNDDSDGDGLSNVQEYIAGTYAFDNKDGFSLKIIRSEGTNPVMEFLAITGHTYSVLGSNDLKTWTPVLFRVAGTEAEPDSVLYVKDTRVLQIEATGPGLTLSFFKLMTE